jgi:hypothetical protein
LFSSNHGPGVFLGSGSSALVEDCDFLDHVGRRAGYISSSHLEIRRCRFLRNTSSAAYGSGGALYIANGSTGVVEFCTFAKDSSHSGYGGAITSDANDVEFSNNTFVECFASVRGSAVQISSPGTFHENIVAYCSGGAAVRGTPATGSGCNAFWMNEGGNYHADWNPDPTDLEADPLFCDPENGNFEVSSLSPCLPENNPFGCDLIGAFGEGCGAVSVTPKSWGRLKAAYRETGEGRP